MRKLKGMKLFFGITLLMVGIVALVGCAANTPSARKQAEAQTAQNQERALADIPVPQPRNFLTRETVVKWVERQDTPDRPHYVYVMGDNGNYIGYYVAQSRPVNTCTFLSPPDKALWGHNGASVVLQQPALDGVYYGGGSCDQWFFFDSETDAMVELTGFKVFTSDQPLNVNATPIKVMVTETP